MNTQETHINWEESPEGTTHAMMDDYDHVGWFKNTYEAVLYWNYNSNSWKEASSRIIKDYDSIVKPQSNEYLDNLHEQIRKAYEMGYKECLSYQGISTSESWVEDTVKRASLKYMENFK